eukprot:173386_1
MSKAKKNLASKFAGTKAGRSVIVNLLGDDGEMIVDTFKDALTKSSDKASAKVVKANVFKLAMKGKFMADKEQFDKEKSELLPSPLGHLMRCLTYLLSDDKGDATVDQLKDLYKEVTDLACELMNPNMTDKNQAMLRETIDIVANAGVMEKLAEDPAFKDEREILHKTFDNMLMMQDEEYSLSANSKLDSTAFTAQYKEEIALAQGIWKKVMEDKERLGMSIFNRLVENHQQYYNGLCECSYGDDPLKQQEVVLDFIDECLTQMGSDWDGVKTKLADVGSKHPEWAAPVSLEGYSHLNQAVHVGLAKVFPDYPGSEDMKALNVLMRLLGFVAKESACKAGVE